MRSSVGSGVGGKCGARGRWLTNGHHYWPVQWRSVWLRGRKGAVMVRCHFLYPIFSVISFFRLLQYVYVPDDRVASL